MKRIAVAYTLILFSFLMTNAQCVSWVGNPRESEATDAHTIYRQQLKGENYEAAFPEWQKAYSLAPAADGRRDFHFTDGITLYKHKLKNAKDDAEKKQHIEAILKLYDALIDCYSQGGFSLSAYNTDELKSKKLASYMGRKAYDMFYEFRSPYEDIEKVLAQAVATGGKNIEYTILDPYANVSVWLYQNKKKTAEETRRVQETLDSLSHINIENDKTYSAYWKQANELMHTAYAPIEREIFDCAYLKKKYLKEYEANPDDGELIRQIYNYLKQGGCSDNDPDLKKLKQEYESYASETNEQLRAEYEANNPGAAARRLYEEGKYSEALEKYREAIAEEKDNEKKAQYYFGMASIEFRKLKHYPTAREYARKAASLKPGWGRPYMLIGDMYASTSSSCGADECEKHYGILAALDKYAYAQSIDPEVASEANSRISKFAAAKPNAEACFMKGVKEGQTVTVGGWIGETVRIRFSNP